MAKNPVSNLSFWQPLLGWLIVVTLCAIPLVRWFAFNAHTYHADTFYDIATLLAKLTGLIGLMLYALNMVFATRLRIFEAWFGGLNRVYIAHHLIGAVAFIFLIIHPGLIFVRTATQSLTSVLTALLPHIRPHYTQADWAYNFALVSFYGTTILLVLTLYVKLPYKVWFATHRWLGVFFFFAGLHVLLVTSDTSIDMFQRWYILGFTALGLLAFAYRTLFGRVLVKRYRYYVEDINVVNNMITQLTLRPVKRPLRFEAGQFVFIRFLHATDRGMGDEAHPFSITSAPDDKFLRIDAKALGDYTANLGKLKKGMLAEVEGSYGRFSYRRYRNPRQIWIAGGIGVTPFLSMTRNLHNDRNFHKMHIDFYYSVKQASEVIDFGALFGVAHDHPKNFRVFPHLTNDAGLLTAKRIAEDSGGLAGKEILMCGPPPMMRALKLQFISLGVPKGKIHTEEFDIL